MKKRIIVLMFINLAFLLFAKTGPVSGEKNLRVIKTQWFDIIYPEKCYKSAYILYQNADSIYYEVTEQYGRVPLDRMPIVITSTVDYLNAFWSSFPYNHIVLYDTSHSELNEIAVFSETLLSIFKHELTHAVTYNMTDESWRKWTKIFGDFINPGNLLVTTGMAEGATLTSESANGEGRLNDEYSKHKVKQAKIEGKFPSYYQVQGAGSLNPYYFNGAFHQWLQDEYGMEKYADFWFSTVNGKNLTVAKRFKKAFGEKLNVAWSRFIDSYQVPNIPSNPVASKQVKDFFNHESDDYSRNNNGGAVYTSLTRSNTSLYWLDNKTKNVYTTTIDSFNTKKPQVKKLFIQNGLYNVTSSLDNKYLALSYYKNNSSTIKAGVKIYNTKTKQFFTIKESGLKDASIIKIQDDYYLIASKFISPYNSIQFYKIKTKPNGKIYGLQKIKEEVLPLNVFTTQYIQLENSFAYIKKDKLKYSICVSNIDGEVLQEYYTPYERMSLNYLSFQDNKFIFSWAKEGTMPRYGYVELIQNKEPQEDQNHNSSTIFYLSNLDLSGGIFNPTLVDTNIVYIGNFLHQRRLLTLDINQHDDYLTVESPVHFSKESSLLYKTFEKHDLIEDYDPNFAKIESEKYNAFNYLTRGIFAPVYLNCIEYISKEDGILPVFCTLGGTYITANPWTNGSSDLFILTGAYNTFYNRFDFGLTSNVGTDTSLFYFNSDFRSGFKIKGGWDYSSFDFLFGSAFNFGRFSSFSLQNSTETYISDDTYYSLYDALSLSYNNVRNVGPGSYQKTGIKTTIGGFCRYQGHFNGESNPSFINSLFASVYTYIPQLLPFTSKYAYTTNLPSVLGIELIPQKETSNNKDFLRFSAESLVFGQTIEKPLILLKGIFIQEWNLSLGYQGDISPNKEDINKDDYLSIVNNFEEIFNNNYIYQDCVFLKASLSFSPNIGTFASNSFKCSVYSKLILNIRPWDIKEEGINFTFGLDLNM